MKPAVVVLALILLMQCRDAARETSSTDRSVGTTAATSATSGQPKQEPPRPPSPTELVEQATDALAAKSWTSAKELATEAANTATAHEISATAKAIIKKAEASEAAEEKGNRKVEKTTTVTWVLKSVGEPTDRGSKRLRTTAKAKCWAAWRIDRIDWKVDATDRDRVAEALSGRPFQDVRVSMKNLGRDENIPTLVVRTHRGNASFSLPLGPDERNRTIAFDAVKPTFWEDAELLCD